jgi:hypothetical protein
MANAIWVLLGVAAGLTLIFGAIRATSAVGRGPDFVRRMLVIFGAFIALASIPLLAGT